MSEYLSLHIRRAGLMTRHSSAIGYVLLFAGLLAWAPTTRAQTDEIQVHDAEITAPGQFNLTWHNNFTPSGRVQPAFPGGLTRATDSSVLKLILVHDL